MTQLVPLLLALSSTACSTLYSDAQNAGRRSDQARQEAERAMKQASRQAVSAQPVGGEALVRLLAGNSHVQVYVKRSSDIRPYFTSYNYFASDGRFIARDTYSKRAPPYEGKGHWRVEKDRLCITTQSEGTDAGCFRIRLAADGAIQYWIHNPGGAYDGMLTKNITDVRPGLQEPEYISDPAAFR